jgi:hypothetical protein
MIKTLILHLDALRLLLLLREMVVDAQQADMTSMGSAEQLRVFHHVATKQRTTNKQASKQDL